MFAAVLMGVLLIGPVSVMVFSLVQLFVVVPVAILVKDEALAERLTVLISVGIVAALVYIGDAYAAMPHYW